jgi:hypothetical protein
MPRSSVLHLKQPGEGQGLESLHASRAPMAGMDRVRGVFDHSAVLADDPSAGAVVADVVRFALPRARSGMDRDVGGDRWGDRTLEICGSLLDGMELDSGRDPIRCGVAAVQPVAKRIQSNAVVRGSRNRGWKSGTAPDHHRDSDTGAASSVSGSSVRDAGMECGCGAGGVLGADRVCGNHRRGDDSHGGRGVGRKVWRRVQAISINSAGNSSADLAGVWSSADD